MEKISNIYQKMIHNQYVFETKEYTDAINSLICLDKETNCLDMLYGLASSRNFANTFALSYILEHLSKDFLLSNRNDICKIIRLAVGKRYFRANFYLCNILIDLMQNKEDYELYLDIMCSANEIEQNNAIYNLIYLKKEDFLIFDKLSKYDFSVFYTNHQIDKNWFRNKIQNCDLIYIKIVLSSIFYKIKDKTFVYSLTNQDNPDLFDFIFFFPDKV